MNAFYATGIVFFMWPVLALTLICHYCFDMVVLFGVAAVAKLQQLKGLFVRRFAAFFVASFGADALAALVILLLSAVAQSHPALSDAMESPFAGLPGSGAAVAVILLVIGAGALKHWLYRRFVFRALQADCKQRAFFLFVLSLLTTPWLFLLPTRLVVEWLGAIMSCLGALSGTSA